MLIQRRDDGRLRMIAQHDHGLLAGELAAAWREADGSELPSELVLATALHDLAWRELDDEPRWNPETGQPHDFLDFPPEEKYRAASEAIDRLEELHPWAAVLVSLHYSTFGSPGRPPGFEESEEERRLELLDELEELEEAAPEPARLHRDLDFLRLFDNLSLYLCLAAPGAREESRPRWLTPQRFGIPGSDVRLELSWNDETEVVVGPFRFEEGLDLELPYRDLPGGPFESGEALLKAWREAEEKTSPLRIRPSAEPSEPGDASLSTR